MFARQTDPHGTQLNLISAVKSPTKVSALRHEHVYIHQGIVYCIVTQIDNFVKITCALKKRLPIENYKINNNTTIIIGKQILICFRCNLKSEEFYFIWFADEGIVIICLEKNLKRSSMNFTLT